VAGNAQSGQAGVPLPLPVTVSATTRNGPAAALVVRFQVETGGGSLSRSQGSTDESGSVSVQWTPGGTLGEQRLRISADRATPVTATATASAGPPALITIAEGNGQFTVVRRAVPVPVKVRVSDAFGNPLAAQPVRFSVSIGGGSITDSTPTTDAGGFASLGSWTLGPVPGFNRLDVSAAPANQVVIAVGTAGSLVATAGDGQTANAGTRTGARPAVTAYDGDGQPLPGTPVTFEVATGGGAVRSPSQVTGADGTARPEAWILGPAPGTNTLSATTVGVPMVQFTATGVPGVASTMVASSPVSFAGLFGNFLDAQPEIRITDVSGAPVAGVAVGWNASDDGQVVGPASATDFDGRAGAAGWRLGPAAPSQQLEASAAGLAPVQFTAEASPLPPAEFSIEIRYPNNQPTTAQKTAFDNAIARWTSAILGDQTDIPLDVPASSSGCYPALNETVDDLLIFADLVEIDGAGGVLGSAGPCLIRTANRLTVVGRMRFDVADLATLEANAQLESVILHEMGHVLGIGSLWSLQQLLAGGGSIDPYFLGRTARAAFLDAAGPAGFTGNIVPVENSGGAGTRDVHWRETSLRNELMTGFINSGANPLSAITIASLRDQGYLVNDAVGEPFTLPQFLVLLGAPGTQLREVPAPWPVYTVDRGGRIDGVVPRR